ncbi:MAG: class I SAM-dependent methyltransferase [Pyrinomonadaceae bacterium]
MSGFIGGEIGYRILKAIGEQDNLDASAFANKSKIEVLLGKDFWHEIENKVVIDFGCGFGEDTIEMAERGAKKVIGLDIREEVLSVARENSLQNNVSAKCAFVTKTGEKADVITSIDAFEHFENPAEILRVMRGLLKEDGKVCRFRSNLVSSAGRSSFFSFSFFSFNLYGKRVNSLAFRL